MADFKNFDPNLYVTTFAGILVRGYSADTFITAARNEDAYSEAVGAQGDVVRVRSNNKSGIVTLSLQAESPVNDLFSTRLALDELTPGGIATGALLIKNLQGTTVISAENAYLRKFADVEVGVDASNRSWVIACPVLNMYVGGSVV